MELTDRDDGTTVTAPAGSVITVRLHEARTGGYQWTLDTGGGGPAGLVVLTSEEFRPGARPGGLADHEFLFETRGRGRARLTLVHRRPWEPDEPGEPGARRWRVDVVVTGAPPERLGSE